VSGTEASRVHSPLFRAAFRVKVYVWRKCLQETHEVATALPLGPTTDRWRLKTILSDSVDAADSKRPTI